MRSFIAYTVSGMFHVAVLAGLAGFTDTPPQLLSVEQGRASVESVAAVAAQPQSDELAELVLERPEAAGSHAPEPRKLDPEPLEVARAPNPIEILRREAEPDPEETPPKLAKQAERKPEPQDEFRPPELQRPDKQPARAPRVETPTEIVAMASTPSTASQASAGAEDEELPKSAQSNIAPVYPAAARAAGQTGTIEARVTISAEGVVTEVALHTSSGFAELDAAALEAFRHWRFVPARRGGRPIPFAGLLRHHFSIRSN